MRTPSSGSASRRKAGRQDARHAEGQPVLAAGEVAQLGRQDLREAGDRQRDHREEDGADPQRQQADDERHDDGDARRRRRRRAGSASSRAHRRAPARWRRHRRRCRRTWCGRTRRCRCSPAGCRSSTASTTKMQMRAATASDRVPGKKNGAKASADQQQHDQRRRDGMPRRSPEIRRMEPCRATSSARAPGSRPRGRHSSTAHHQHDVGAERQGRRQEADIVGGEPDQHARRRSSR